MDATSVPRFIATILLVGGAAIFLWPLVSSGWAKVSGTFKAATPSPSIDWQTRHLAAINSGYAFVNALAALGDAEEAMAGRALLSRLVLFQPQLPAPTAAPTVINVASAPSVP